MQGVVAVSQKSEREHLLAAEGASASLGVSSPIGRSVGRSVTYFSVACNMMRGGAVQMQCWEEGLAAARMQRKLSYRCSSGSGSGRTMGSSTGCSSAEDVGKEGLTSAQVLMPHD